MAAAAEVNVAMINYYFGTRKNYSRAWWNRRLLLTRGILDEIAKDQTLSSIGKINTDY